VQTGSATVSLASDTPAAASIADAGNANFTKFTLTTGSSPVTVSSMTVTRYGLSSNSDLENVKILDGNMVSLGNSASFNSNSKAKVTFVPSVTLAANSSHSFYIRAGVVDNTSAGKTIQLGIATSADIESSAAITGSFPAVGNPMTTVLVGIGSVQVTNDGTVVNNGPDVGDTNVELNKFKISAGSVEPITIQQISLERQGSAGASDVANIELFDVTHNVSLGTVGTWNSQGLAVFNNLNLVIDKGDTVRFKVMADIVDGVGLTVNADLTDGSDVRIQAKGNDFGFFITPTITGGWDGKGATNQTIGSAALLISKSSSTPATGNIVAADDQLITVLDVVVTGEPVRVTSFKVGFNLGTMAVSEVTNARIRNFTTGASLSGPNTVSTGPYDPNSSSSYEATATFTDTLEFPVGTTKVGIYADISSDTSANDTIMAGVPDADSDITARGVQSNDTVTATPGASEVNGNTLTIQDASLSAITLSQPAARSIAKGVQDFVWATFDLSAISSGEDINVTALVLEDTLGDAGDDAGDIDNVEIWADLTSASSARGDAFETKVSDTKQFADSGAADETLSITLSQTVKVIRNSSVRMAVVADLAADATTGDTHTISLDTDAGDVTANGANSGDSVSVTPTGAGQTMTVATGGDVTVTVDSSSPSAKLVLDGGQGGKETLGIFRLAANNVENLNLDSFKITDDGTGDDGVSTYYFQATSKGGVALGSEKSVTGGATAEAFWGSGEVTVPANDYILIVVKGVTNPVDGTAVVNGDDIRVTVAASGDVDTTGLASGTAVDTDDTSVDAAIHELYESYPTFAFDNTGISTTLTGTTNHLAAKLKVTVIGNEDVTFHTADSPVFSVQVVVSGSDDDAGTENVTLKDSDGNTLDSSTITSATGTTQVDYNFSTTDETIAAGATTTWYVYVDTSDLETDGATLQVWLDDTAADVTFGINGTGAYAEGDIILRGDLFGVAAVNPS